MGSVGVDDIVIVDEEGYRYRWIAHPTVLYVYECCIYLKKIGFPVQLYIQLQGNYVKFPNCTKRRIGKC